MGTRQFAWAGVIVGALVVACSSGDAMLGDGGDNPDSATTNDDGGTGGMGDGAMGTDTGADGTMTGTDTGVADTGVNDPYAAARAACVAEINKLRATENKQPYAHWTSPAIDMCVDQQATSDEMSKVAHQAWSQKKYPTCNGNGQNECLGYGVTPAAIVKCLDAMWAEKYQQNCSGCPACANQYTPNCPNCDFYGMNGMQCGHYVNMSANWLKKVACGFSNLGGWAVQNFSQ